jgi:hypothetical protein
MNIRSVTLTITLACIALASGLNAKSKLGEYYLGFSYFGGDSNNLDVSSLAVEMSNPMSDNNDLVVGLDWMNVDAAGGGDATSWWLEADYIYHYDSYMDSGGMFRPYLSGGVGYSNDPGKVILGENAFNWKLAVGSEIIFNNNFSASFGLNFYGLWSNFGTNASEFEISMLYWLEETHGIGLEYRQSNDTNADYLGLRYLYSWQ